MKKLIAISGIVLPLALGTAVWLNARNSPPASSPPEPGSTTVTPGEPSVPTPGPTIGATTANPAVIAVNMPTAVTITSVIPDPSVIPTGVNLLRLNSNGTSTVIGQLKDDGRNGDAAAGDKTFTTVKSFNETVTGQVQLQVSAAFRGLLKRVMSPIVNLEIWNVFRDVSLGITVNYPSGWNVRQDGARVVISNTPTTSTLSEAALQAESSFEIRILGNSNPGILEIDKWFDQHFTKGFSVPPLARSSAIVAGTSAVRIETSEIGKRVHLYVPKAADVIEITYGLFAPQFIDDYNAILNSLFLQ